MKKIRLSWFLANIISEKTSANNWCLRSLKSAKTASFFRYFLSRGDCKSAKYIYIIANRRHVLLAFYALFQVVHGRDGFIRKRLSMLCGCLVDLVVYPALDVLVDGHLVQTKAQRRGRRLEASQEEHEHLWNPIYEYARVRSIPPPLSVRFSSAVSTACALRTISTRPLCCREFYTYTRNTRTPTGL